MQNNLNISGFILAGGESSRMGFDKGLIEYRGKQLIMYALDTIQDVCDLVSICTANEEYARFKHPLIGDIYKGVGPVGGIHSALMHTESEWNLFLPCDSPYINKELLKYMLNHRQGYTAVIPRYLDKYYPTIALLHKSCGEIFEKAILKRDYKVLLPLFNCKLKILDIDHTHSFFTNELFHNINTESDLFIK